ncbi:hypothetical protein GTQ34_16235 [Muricauda sp. JGD-17]|uniref:Uncharacterized protein n=1 Tax=Flagellimonas ochracea TaxID=2696472 RepID=A0A964WYQ1_9FLAO|nr:hypothetical protein [Allomuricauda ochracea]NAY93461.1 hypothetical protein [Allomuricauda ochracea]
MKTILTTLLIFIITLCGIVQVNAQAMKLVELLHSEEIAQRKRGLNEIARAENLKMEGKESSDDELYQNLVSVYSSVFNEQEIQDLIAIQESTANQAFLKRKGELQRRCREVFDDWEKRLVFDDLENKIRSGTDRNGGAESQQKSILAREYPKVRDSEYLKKILSENPTILEDFRLLVDFLEPQEFELFFDAKIIKN